MKALSVRQPWAWLIIHGGKDIENRTWPTKFRGQSLIHAAKGMTRHEYETVEGDLLCHAGTAAVDLPPYEELARGGIIGSVEVVDCVSASDSAWFAGPYGFVLRSPSPMEFLPFKGQLGFFEVPDDLLIGKFKQHATMASVAIR